MKYFRIVAPQTCTITVPATSFRRITPPVRGFTSPVMKAEKRSAPLPPIDFVPIAKKRRIDEEKVLEPEQRSILEKEFEKIGQTTEADEKMLSNFTTALLPYNYLKNRYSNVLPYEKTRVRLSIENSSDFINANWIRGLVEGSDKAYIAAQGPTDQTTFDFWKMVWETNCSVIVMLTREVESDKQKCAIYWPTSSVTPLESSSFRISLEFERAEGTHLHCRYFMIDNLKTNETRRVHHFQFMEWPDHGVPSSRAPFLKLIEHVNHSNSQNAPIIVHCSAGIGRTGTFCAVHSIWEKMKQEKLSNQTINPNILYDTVLGLRKQRPGMVQTLEQYLFCYLALQDIYLSLLPDAALF